MTITLLNSLESIGRLKQIGFWIQLGGIDIASRYRRSFLGAFWIVLVNSLTIIAIGLVYSSLFGIELQSYFPFLVVGYIFWLWISASLLEMTSSLTAYRYILINNAVDPIAVFARVYARNLIILVHNIPILIVVLALYGPELSLINFLVLPNFLIIGSVIFLGSGMLAFFAARFQDVQHLITASIGVLFLITPIIWSPEILTERAYIASVNPLTHVIELLRAPLLGRVPKALNYFVCVGLLAILFFGFSQTYKLYHRRYMFWI